MPPEWECLRGVAALALLYDLPLLLLSAVAQRVQFFKLQTRNVGGQGAEPLAFSWGSKGAILSRERMAPLSVQRHRRCLSLPRRARETPSPVGQIKKVQLFLKNPLDKWAPRAIMQPTSEELQTYDGEK